ncbi:MAG: lytic transglycosylase domain-containing protein [Tsuneonella troitsensis]
MRLTLLAISASLAVACSPAPSTAQDMSFDAYLQVLIARARAEGVSEPTIQRMTYDLTPNTRVIELDRAQPGTPSSSGSFPRLQTYLDRHVDAARINGGRRNYQALGPLASQLEARYGVPAKMLIAIWGHETNYGSYTGDFDLARSLATLAWEGRRRDLFATEFVDLLKVADLGVNRSTLKGSWAGAFGYPQFLPSIYLRLAQDGDGDGRRDIWNNRSDTLASIANYFRDAGWRRGQPWGVQASVPSGLDWNALRSPMNSPVCNSVHQRHSRWMSVGEWKRMGVQPLANLDDTVTASLFQPDGPGTRAWLLTANYRVILEYNCSNYYAMSVGLLADEIAR